MNYTYKKLIARVVLSALSFTTLAQAYTSEYYDSVANNYFNSLGKMEAIPKKEETQPKGLGDLFKVLYQKHEFELHTSSFSNRQLSEVAFQFDPQKIDSSKDLVNKTFADKMELFYGTGENPQETILNALTSAKKDGTRTNFINTRIGALHAVQLLSQPTSNVKELKRRQGLVEALVSNPVLMNTLDKELQKIRTAEPYMYEILLQEKMPMMEDTGYTPFDFINKSPNSIGFLQRLTQLGLLGFFVGCIYGPYKWASFMINEGNITDFAGKAGMYSVAYAFGGFYNLLISAATMMQYYMSADMHAKLIGVGTYLRSMKKIYDSSEQNTNFIANMPTLRELECLQHQSSRHTDDFNKLTKLMVETNTFTGSSAPILSATGRIFAANKLLHIDQVREEIRELMSVIGELDAYLAVAKKIKAQQKKKTRYCKVTFINKNKPYINIKGMWNILVGDKSVLNDVELGDINPRNIILTGPNTGGKSTLMKGVMTDVLFAQTFGFAPAQEMVMTPFEIMHCYMNVSDDTAAGLSGLKAQVEHAKQLCDSIEKLQGKNKFAFLIIDEIFTGTSPDQAEDLAYRFIDQLAHLQNCMFIDATHFAKLINLEDETTSCRNCHMGAVLDSNGKVQQYTYKIENGPSTVHNAMQVAQDSNIFW